MRNYAVGGDELRQPHNSPPVTKVLAYFPPHKFPFSAFFSSTNYLLRTIFLHFFGCHSVVLFGIILEFRSHPATKVPGPGLAGPLERELAAFGVYTLVALALAVTSVTGHSQRAQITHSGSGF